MRSTAAKLLLSSLGVALALSGCGSSGGSSSRAHAAAATLPGSPQAIVTAAAEALGRRDYGALCQYILRAPQQPCATGAPNTFTVAGFKLGNSAVRGNRALVVILANRVCVLQRRCESNHNPNAGMPHGSLTFDDAWRRSTVGSAFFTASLTEVSGKWYIVALLKRT